MKVYLVGVGLGNPATMTLAAREAIAASPLLIGAPRLLEGYEKKRCVRAILAKDIAAAIAYLGSDDASWTTGEVLDVNGGLQY